MASCNHMCYHSCNGSLEPFFNKAMLSKGVTILSPHSYYTYLAFQSPRFVSNRVYLVSFGTASWASYEFARTRDKATANME
ncbi:hypothetical protein TNCV_636931 [Trichonephila clavipes]|nr:hypothetical protein TNCV_636931 [Trichonephila clavipes]